jgi:NADH-quinone oxidoreductase subunit L
MDINVISGWLVWVVPLVACLFVPLIAKYSAKARNYFVIAISAVTGGLALSLVPGIFSGSGQAVDNYVQWFSGFSVGVYIDPLAVLFAVLVAFFGLIIAVYSWGYMHGEEGLTRYYFLLLLFIGSMIGLVISDNLIQMFLFWEMVGFCSYALVSFWYKRKESVNAGVKVFIMTRIGDISLLAAIGILFATFGTFSFHGIISGLQTQASDGTLNMGLMGIVAFLVLGGAIAKSAQLPLFTWLYSAMEAPTSISALLHAATMVKAGIYLLARFILIAAAVPALMIALGQYWFPTVAWLGVLTAFIGASLAFTTTDLKGVLAYSTVSQIGFMMAALGAALQGPASTGWFASLFQMVSHAFFEGLGFLLAGGIIHALGTRDMRLMGGLRKAMPVTFGLMVIMVITTSGLPPFAAFFSKGLVLTSVSGAGYLVEAVILYATTAITFAYCVRMLTLVFMGKESDHLIAQHPHEAPKVMLIPAAILAGLCIVWGLAEPLIMSFMHVNLGISLLGAFTDIEFPIFIALLIPTGLLVYWAYYKNTQIRTVASGPNPITTVLNHAYFFDDLYYAIAKGTGKIAEGLGVVEDTLFNRFPQAAAQSVVVGARSAEKSLDDLSNRLLHVLSPSRQMSDEDKKSSLQHYLAAGVLGFILIVILIILTVGAGL